MKPYRNILIVRTDRVGDVVLTTPVIAALRAAYPKARISMLVAPATRELLAGNPYLDAVLIDDRKGKHRGFKGFLCLVSGLKEQNFDAAFIFHTKKRTNLLCWLAGIPERVGYKNDKWGFLLTERLVDTRPQGTKHEVEYCLDVLRALGIPCANPRPFLAVDKEADQWAQKALKEKASWIAIHPGASCVSKRWAPERFAEVANHLIEERLCQIVFIGGPENHKIMEQVKAALKHPVMDLTGQTSLTRTAGILKRCRLLISNDSGPVHMASALGVAVVSIFGRNQAGLSPLRWRPLGEKNTVLHKEVGCVVCLAHNCQIDFKCLEEITVPEVLEAVRQRIY